MAKKQKMFGEDEVKKIKPLKTKMPKIDTKVKMPKLTAKIKGVKGI